MKLPDEKTGTPNAKLARVLTAIVGIALVVPIFVLGGAWFNALAILLAFAGLRELAVAARVAGVRLVPEIAYPALAWSLWALWQSAGAWGDTRESSRVLMIVAAALFAVPVALLARAVFRFAGRKPASLASVALSQFAVFYCALFGFVMLLRALPAPYGASLFWLAILGVWAGDIMAYYGGKLFGRRKLSSLSPGKTWEGLWCGVAASLVVCLAVSWSWAAPFEWRDKIVLACLVAFFAPLGDLAESFLKRELDVKDLGRALPGHGGILDRCDSLLFAALPVYFYAIWQIVE